MSVALGPVCQHADDSDRKAGLISAWRSARQEDGPSRRAGRDRGCGPHRAGGDNGHVTPDHAERLHGTSDGARSATGYYNLAAWTPQPSSRFAL